MSSLLQSIKAKYYDMRNTYRYKTKGCATGGG